MTRITCGSHRINTTVSLEPLQKRENDLLKEATSLISNVVSKEHLTYTAEGLRNPSDKNQRYAHHKSSYRLKGLKRPALRMLSLLTIGSSFLANGFTIARNAFYGHIPKYYNDPAIIQDRRVYKHVNAIVAGIPKLIHQCVSPSIKKRVLSGESNLQLMKTGNAPLGPDGKQMELHHMLQEEPGPMAEIISTVHTRYHRALHGTKEVSFRRQSGLKKQFNKFRKNYWKLRAEDFKANLTANSTIS